MRSTVIMNTIQEALTVNEVKKYLRIDNNANDDLIDKLIVSARVQSRKLLGSKYSIQGAKNYR